MRQKQANNPRPRTPSASAGFTLLELLLTAGVVLCLVGAGVGFASRTRSSQQANGERVLSSLARIISTRQAQVRQFNLKSLAGGTSLENNLSSNVGAFDVDFGAPDTTRDLVLDGTDANGDGLDDNTGQQLTVRQGNTLVAGFSGVPLQLPPGWRVALTQADLGGIPMIAGGTNQRGRVARCVTFSPDGSTLPLGQDPAQPSKCGGDTASTSGTSRAMNFSPDASPFLAVYAVYTPPGSSTAQAGAALAIYPSGYTEPFRWDGTVWRGYNGRVVGQPAPHNITPTPMPLPSPGDISVDEEP